MSPGRLEYAREAEKLVIWFRWLAALVAGVVVNVLSPEAGAVGTFNWLLALAVVYNATLMVVVDRPRWSPALPVLSSSLDIFFIVVGCGLTGGLESDIRYLYFFAPATVAIRFNLPYTLLFGAFASMTVLALALPAGISPSEGRQVGIFITFLQFMALVVGMLAHLVIRSRDELEQRVAARTEELRVANEHLKSLDRLKSDFVNAVSHELRTPLTTIIGYSEFLDDEVGGPISRDQREYVGQIRAGARRLMRLVDDLLDYARLESGTFRLVLGPNDLGARLREVSEGLRPSLAAKGLVLRLETPEAPAWVIADADRLDQVLSNLIYNSIKFTPPSGAIAVAIAPDGEAWRVRVTDSGPGVPPEHRDRLFDKFYQVTASPNRKPQGAGLGLAIARAIVEAHGGRIGLDASEGGASFWFTLPAATEAAIAPV